MRFSQFKILLLMLALLLSGIAHAQGSENQAQVKNTVTSADVRQYPHPQSKGLLALGRGTSVSVLARLNGNDWVLVKTAQSVIGWVDADLLEYAFDFNTLPQVTVNIPDLDTGTDSGATEVTTVTEVSQDSEVTEDVEMVAIAGAVRDMGSTLRMRTAPNLFSSVIADLKGRTPLEVNGRYSTAWLFVTVEDLTGWVSAEFIDLPRGFDLSTLPEISAEMETSPATRESSDTGSAPLTGNFTGAAAIFQQGKALGNRATVFAKVGDSVTVAQEMYDAIGRGMYTLGAFSGLKATIDHFTSDFNSFTHVSAAAGPGWTSATALDPRFADPSVCPSGVMPIECEYNRIKPAIALIMLGTNDVKFLNSDEYAFNMNRIVEISRASGVIPVLSTIPYREGYEAKVEAFNTIVRNVATTQDVPLWDYHSAMAGLPAFGLSGDGVHPSVPSGGYADSANFTGENLTSGYVVRNLTALQVLESVRRSAMTP